MVGRAFSFALRLIPASSSYAIASVDDIRPRFRHDFGTKITRKGVDLLSGKELMRINSDKVYCRYT
jgi:integrase/recombinase XerD